MTSKSNHISEPEHTTEVEFLLTNDSTMTQLNEKMFGKSTPTDVISLPLQETVDDSREILGQIVVNKDAVSSNAKAFGTSYELELARVVTHGVLHLLGYTDDTGSSKKLMTALEDVVVSSYDQDVDGTLFVKLPKDQD